jgi:hypothetical protein
MARSAGGALEVSLLHATAAHRFWFQEFVMNQGSRPIAA